MNRTEMKMVAILDIDSVSKTYLGGHVALSAVSLRIRKGEILALLGPNGAGKTTLISIICGLVTPSSGRVKVAGHDIIADFRAARQKIGLVPQELTLDYFETVWNTLTFSRGLFGLPPNKAHLEHVLQSLSLWDKRKAQIRTLSGGMKRRLLIAKALAHEPEILFLDEPTAGVDVELRQDMWQLIDQLRQKGTTIILTTHYIEEAEELADRIGVINQGKLLLVEDKAVLMQKLGKKQMHIELTEPVYSLPDSLADYSLSLSEDGTILTYDYDTQAGRTGIAALLHDLNAAGIRLCDLQTAQSSLEDIFVGLIGRNGTPHTA